MFGLELRLHRRDAGRVKTGLNAPRCIERNTDKKADNGSEHGELTQSGKDPLPREASKQEVGTP